MYRRDNAGVKVRADNKGDPWASAHRSLGPGFNMQDLDALFGYMAFGQNTGERLFLEYVPDNYVNRYNSVRNFGVVALFDRKASFAAMEHEENTVSKAFYLWLCRALGQCQPVAPKFFYVIGQDSPPWIIIEIALDTGLPTGKEATLLSSSNWLPVWTVLGLVEHRDLIRQWIDPQ